MANTTYQETNQYGEAQNMTITDAQKQVLSDGLPANAQVTAVTAVATADAPAQTNAYVQADVEAIRTLANSVKAKLNELLTALKA